MFVRTLLASLLAAAAVITAVPVPGDRKLDIMLPMRDGVALRTLIFFPKDYHNGQFTAVVDRSPYGYHDMEWITDLFLPFGFVAVGQVGLISYYQRFRFCVS
jgi:predicted acyl esterase